MTRRKDAKADLEEYLTYAAPSLGLPWVLVPEYKFHPKRKFRLDWAWPEGKVGIEFDGVMMRTVGHNSLAGILRDSEKSNLAQAMGWRVFRANAKNVGDESFFALIDSVLIEEAT